MSKDNSFVRLHCESCGAPFKKTHHKGKYICEYCGSVFFDSNYEDTTWEEVNENNFEPSEFNFSSTPKNIASTRTQNKKVGIWAWLIAGAILFSCIAFGIFGEIFNNLGNDSTVSIKKTINIPTMLSILPSAEQAGNSIAYAGWELRVDPEFIIDENRLFFSINLKNWNDSNQTLNYQPNTIIVYDDLQNTYPLQIGNCDIDLPYLNRQVTFEPYEEIDFSSSKYWCNDANNLPTYFGTLTVNAEHLYLYLENFGVFQNITFVFDL